MLFDEILSITLSIILPIVGFISSLITIKLYIEFNSSELTAALLLIRAAEEEDEEGNYDRCLEYYRTCLKTFKKFHNKTKCQELKSIIMRIELKKAKWEKRKAEENEAE